ncbi:MAG: prepilin peptidase [Alphaproteobacteria bacterium]|nr:prepilin peptidase [Alphaproteobacteria bacterium]
MTELASFIAVSAILPCCMAYAIYSDLGRLEIPNWASIAPALAYLPAALLSDQSMLIIGAHYAIGVAVFIVGAILFALKIMGGGDVKLLGAAAIWTGWELLPPFLLLVAIFGGLLSILALILRRRFFKFLYRYLPWTDPDQPASVPYGLAIGSASIFLFPKIPGVAAAWDNLASAL